MSATEEAYSGEEATEDAMEDTTEQQTPGGGTLA
jgi:hypothetical protein